MEVRMISENELNQFAKDFLREHFQITNVIPIKRNNRLRSTLGRYVYSKNGKPLRIELAGNLLIYGTKETIYGVLKHECIHYAFHLQGKNMRDGDALFEHTLQQFNAPSTNTLKVGKYFQFTCKKCQKHGESNIKKIKRTPENYRSSCCRAPIVVEGYKIYNGIHNM